MANTNTNTVNTATKKEFDLFTIRDAIIRARAQGNTASISLNNFPELPAQDVQQWHDYCELLQKELRTLNAMVEQTPAPSKTALQKQEAAVFAAWRSVIKNGTEGQFSRSFFIRKTDVYRLFGYNQRFVSVGPKKIKQFGNARPADFRRLVEAMIGARMAGNGIMADADAEVVETYDSAIESKARAEQRLAGYINGKGETVPGLRKQLKAAEATLKSMEDLVASLSMDEDGQAKILKGFRDAVKSLKDDIDSAETTIDKTKDTIAKYRERYEAIVSGLQDIEINAVAQVLNKD